MHNPILPPGPWRSPAEYLGKHILPRDEHHGAPFSARDLTANELTAAELEALHALHQAIRREVEALP